jgi:hypothetical protein
MRFPVLIPVLCYIVATVLAFLCLFAGHEEGFMEDYAVVRVCCPVFCQTEYAPKQLLRYISIAEHFLVGV